MEHSENREAEQKEQMINLLKAVADENRLRIMVMLAVSPRSSQDIASALKLKPAEAAHHLQVLEEMGLVSEEGSQYRYASETIRALSKQTLASRKVARRSPDEFEGPEEDRKILAQYVGPDGRLKSIPTQLKKVMAIMGYVVKPFQPGERYTEKQVNELLKRYNEDYAMLRRYLVDYGYLEREGGGGEYWLKEC
jgi:DNA-binding HxlR family transcriptional regulator